MPSGGHESKLFDIDVVTRFRERTVTDLLLKWNLTSLWTARLWYNNHLVRKFKGGLPSQRGLEQNSLPCRYLSQAPGFPRSSYPQVDRYDDSYSRRVETRRVLSIKRKEEHDMLSDRNTRVGKFEVGQPSQC